MTEPMKVLVTGAAGFIGFHLTRQLIERGDQVVGLDNVNDYYDVNLKYARLAKNGIQRPEISYGRLMASELFPNYQFVKMDITDSKNLQVLFKESQFDVVVNLAAQAGVRYSLINPQAYIKSNINGFQNILECARHFHIKHLVYASSSSVYGLNTLMPFSVNDSVDHPVSLYAASKKSNELMAHAYSHLFNIPTTGLRFFTVYGPWGRPDMALFLFTKAMLEGKPIKVFNNGEMERDFTYIDDIVGGIIRVVDTPAKADPAWNSLHPSPGSSRDPYRIYNIGRGKPVKLMDFVKELEANLGIEARKKLLPLQDGDVCKTWADVRDLEESLNYYPQVSVKEGIKKFVDWYKEFYVSNFQLNVPKTEMA